MTKGNILSVNLGKLSKQWERYCKDRGVSRSDATRQVIRKLVSSVPPDVVDDVPGASALGGLKRRIEIRVTETEHHEIVRLATDAGFSVNAWIVAVIRAQLGDGPQLGQYELEQLSRSNSLLLAIGRNLNQIARVLNSTPENRCVDLVIIIESLTKLVEAHTTEVSTLIRANVERWTR
ncbi:plasmid mobilization relaxosome protein MobC [Burkholderia vietnamiensis]|uniref:Plasmid mobilization relaxosome protein MobC n=1 Tax=Burkholderia vietnamiensis TaxID=60552 RepID=A0ABS1ARI1_BURVI|nr:plasmid mobilization relaxosome protein MobC [Burkholderia vietnamiensis]MBJ9686764.1 plasmid mobilization relaxosome protein MobC [Burkholderia vietnamiensis]